MQETAFASVVLKSKDYSHSETFRGPRIQAVEKYTDYWQPQIDLANETTHLSEVLTVVERTFGETESTIRLDSQAESTRPVLAATIRRIETARTLGWYEEVTPEWQALREKCSFAIGTDPRILTNEQEEARKLYKLCTQARKDASIRQELGDRYVQSTIQKEFSEEFVQKEWEKCAKERATMLGYLQRYHGNIFTLLDSTVANKSIQQREIENLLITEVVLMHKERGYALFRDPKNQKRAVERVGQFLIVHSSQFSRLRKEFEAREKDRSVTERSSPDEKITLEGYNFSNVTIEDLRSIHEAATLGSELADMSHENRVIKVWKWLRKVGSQSFSGVETAEGRKWLKIFPTPYYDELIDRAMFLGRKANGLGGVIYYGPPGTGKTEVAQEVNRREGFGTRVVQVHAFSDFVELIGERTKQVSFGTSSYLEKLRSFQAWFKEDTTKGVEALRTFYSSRKSNGAMTAKSFDAFMSQYIGGTDDGSALTDAEIQVKFLSYLDTQIVGAGLGIENGKEIDQWVNGEILRGIDEGKRVVLDEIDKAGEFAFGGLLTLLAKSQGDVFTVHGKTITLPSWFRVDATANTLEIGKPQRGKEGVMTYFKDRFNALEVGYPPTKDELMIASLFLSDRQGNILLDETEQWQMIGVFNYLIPSLRKFYEEDTENTVTPLTLRTTKELCSYLVDQKTRRRTNVSIHEAIGMLAENRSLALDKATSNDMEQTIKSYHSLYEKSLVVEGVSNQSQPRNEKTKVVETAFDDLLSQPFIRAIADFEIGEGSIHAESHIYFQTISARDHARLVEHLRQVKDHQVDGTTQLGFFLDVEGDKKIKLIGAAEHAPLLSGTKEGNTIGEISMVNADGKVMLCRKGDFYVLVHAWNKTGEEIQVQNLPENRTKEGSVLLTADGQTIIIHKADGQVQVCSSREARESGKYVTLRSENEYLQSKKISLSPDGKYLLSEDENGNHTRIFSLQSIREHASMILANRPSHLRAEAVLQRDGFFFATSNCVANETRPTVALIGSKSYFDTW